MRIEIGYDIVFECPTPVAMILILNVHPSRQKDLETAAPITFDPPIPSRQFTDRFGNVGIRLVAPRGRSG